MEENDKCIDKALVEENYYYLNKENYKYVSCSKISGCKKCNSSTQCYFEFINALKLYFVFL